MRARTYVEAANELGISERWLRTMTPTVPLPHHKFSVDEAGKPSTRGRGAVVFYDDDLDAIRAMFAVKPTEPQRADMRPVTRRRRWD